MLQSNVEMSRANKFILYGMTIFLATVVTLPFIAPILAHYGFKRLSDWIYELYSFMCHQKAHRSLFIFDEQCAWCVRDTFIWATMFAVWLFVMRGKAVPGISWKTAIAFALPMALDGGIQLIGTIVSIYNQTTPFYESTNTTRAITGTLFAIGVGMFLFPRLRNELDS